MKKLLIVISLLLPVGALAQTVENDLVGLGMEPEVAEYLAGIIPAGAALDNNVYLKGDNQAGSATINILKINTSDDLVINSSASDDLILQLEDDASRLITFDAGSDTALSMRYGDGSTTATQVFVLSGSSSDADDDGTLQVCGGGAYATNGSRGACISLPGEEVAGGGDITYTAGGSDTHVFTAGSTETMSIGATGIVTAAGGLVATAGGVTATAGDIVATNGDLQLTATGKTIEYETGTAASACMGTSTFNGTTAVTISTTCATTNSKIFISNTGDGSGTSTNDQSGCWATNIVNATSFDVDCSDAAMNATLNWVIFHEAP